MSLKVWLPLNGDLRNQGLAKINVVNNGTTVDSSGKIGSCYSFNGSSNYLQLNNFSPSGWKEFSISFWCYCTNSITGIFLARADATHQLRFNADGFSFRNTKNSTLRTIPIGATIPTTTWTHIACSYNCGEVYIYVNGIQTAHSTTYYNASAVLNSNINEVRIGRQQSTSGNSYFNGKLNDFRIYDHALSAKEVEELSMGLVLHYKLDKNVNILNNCYSYPTFNTSNGGGGWSHWGPSGHSGTYGQNTDKQYIYNKKNTYSHYISENSGTGKYYLLYQSPSFAGGYRSIQFIIKEENSLPITTSICWPNWNARNGGVPNNKWTSIHHLGNGFYLCKVEGLSQDGSNNLVGIGVQPGYKIYVSEGYCENDREICSDIFSQSKITTVYDSSGYRNNGTITGTTMKTISSSPRYNTSLYFTNYTTYIQRNMGSWTPDAITMSCWIKGTNKSPRGGFHLPLNMHSTNFEISIAGSSGKARMGYMIGGTRRVSDIGSDILDGKWHMLTSTYDGANFCRYIDGELVTSNAYTGALTTLSTLGVGQFPGSTNYGNTQLSESDVRIYTTALTAIQIRELYLTSAAIDKNGDIYAREFDEINASSNPQLKKTGQLLPVNQFQEQVNKVAYIEKSNNIVGSELYEF